MFGYCGSKSRVAHHYPAPRYPLIIEPFAGSARYSLLHWNRWIWINDLYDVITDIWSYLQSATIDQIKSLPSLYKGQDIRRLNITEPERYLLGFCANMGVARPANIVTHWSGNWDRVGQTRRTILANLEHIRHWIISNTDYRNLPNMEATWFIDPPYKGMKHYKHSQINYRELAAWCQSRRGQVIVCEREGATWLPFRPLTCGLGQRSGYCYEAYWTNEKTHQSIAP